MKWVALVTFVFIALYTALTLHYRRPGPAYQPYQDNKERAIVKRLRSAGYQRITAEAERPADAQGSAAKLAGPFVQPSDVAGGVSDELKQTLIDQPRLPVTIAQVRAPAAANRLLPYSLQFTCAQPNNKQMLSGTYVYVKDDDMAIVTDFEPIEGELLARTPETAVQLTIPAGALHEGTYEVTLVGERQSKHWTLQVH